MPSKAAIIQLLVPSLLVVALAGLFLVGPSGPSPASTLKTERFRQAQELGFAKEIEFTNSVCSSAIRARIDWATLAPQNQAPNGDFYTKCGTVLGVLEKLCRCGKAPDVRKRVSTVVCTSGSRGAVLLQGSTLIYTFSVGGTPDYDANEHAVSQAIGVPSCSG